MSLLVYIDIALTDTISCDVRMHTCLHEGVSSLVYLHADLTIYSLGNRRVCHPALI